MASFVSGNLRHIFALCRSPATPTISTRAQCWRAPGISLPLTGIFVPTTGENGTKRTKIKTQSGQSLRRVCVGTTTTAIIFRRRVPVRAARVSASRGDRRRSFPYERRGRRIRVRRLYSGGPPLSLVFRGTGHRGRLYYTLLGPGDCCFSGGRRATHAKRAFELRETARVGNHAHTPVFFLCHVRATRSCLVFGFSLVLWTDGTPRAPSIVRQRLSTAAR